MEHITLYHTGFEKIEQPDIHIGRANADFGQGFYPVSYTHLDVYKRQGQGTQEPADHPGMGSQTGQQSTYDAGVHHAPDDRTV